MSRRGGRTLAQAKVNLSLRVLGRNPDGYHSIETVFLRLELGDDVRLHVREKSRMRTAYRCCLDRAYSRTRRRRVRTRGASAIR